MFTKSSFGKLLVFGLVLVLFANVAFANHYFRHADKTAKFEGESSSDSSSSESSSSETSSSESSSSETSSSESSTSTSSDSGTYSGDSSSGTGTYDSGTYTGTGGSYDSSTTSTSTTTTTDSTTGVQTTTYSGTGYTSVETYDPNTGSRTYTSTNSYVDPSTGETYTTTSTSTSYTDSSGNTVWESSSQYRDYQTGELVTSTSTSKSYTDANGAQITESVSNYYDPVTQEQVTYSSTNTYRSYTDSSGATVYESESQSTDSRTGQTYGSTSTSKSYTGDDGSTVYESNWESSYPDWRTGEIVSTKSTSTSTSRTVTNADGSTTTVSESTYKGDYVDWETGEKKESTSTSYSEYTNNPDGTSTSKSTNNWIDPHSGKESVSVYESTYDPDTGESKSTNSYTDPATGTVYTSYSESKYNSDTGESSYVYKYTDPGTGQELVSESRTERTEDGSYVNIYTLKDAVTGEEVETPYYGCYGGCASGSTYYYLDTESGATFSYTSDESPDSDVHTYRTPEGDTYIYTDGQGERDAIANAYGEAMALAVDAGLPVGEAENDLLKENELLDDVKNGDAVETEVVGEPIVTHEEFLNQIEERHGEALSDAEKELATQEYEAFEERTKQVPVDVSPETYAEYLKLQESLGTEDEALLTPEEFGGVADLRTEFYEKRDAIYDGVDLSDEQKITELDTLEREYSEQYNEQFPDTGVQLEALPEPGVLPEASSEALDNTLPALTLDALDAIISDEFKDDLQRLADLGIPENHPNVMALERMAAEERDKLLEQQDDALLKEMVSGCADSVGGGSESCGQVISEVRELLDSCAGDSASSCRQTVQIMVVQLDPAAMMDKEAVIAETQEIVAEAETALNNPENRDAWIYMVEITPERLVAEDLYRNAERPCLTDSDCGVNPQERLEEHLSDVYDEWKIQYESLTEEQRQEMLARADGIRKEFHDVVEPLSAEVREALHEEQKEVYDEVAEVADMFETERLPLMEEFRDTAAAQGHDVAILDFYLSQYRQYLDGADDRVAHGNFVGAVGSMGAADDTFGLFLETAGEIVKTDGAGEEYESPQDIKVG